MRESEDSNSPLDDVNDRLLAGALASYAGLETLDRDPELENRIIASLRPRIGSSHLRRWTVLIPVAAALFLAAFLPVYVWQAHRSGFRSSANHGPSQMPASAAAKRQEAFVEAPSDLARPEIQQRQAAHYPTPSRIQERPEPLPKQEVFPAPAPLTAQEQALAVLVQRNPGNITQSVARSQDQPVKPLTVAAIVVPPLEIQPSGSPDQGAK